MFLEMAKCARTNEMDSILITKKNWLSQGDKAPKFLGIVQWWTQQASSTSTIQLKILQGNWNLIGRENCEMFHFMFKMCKLRGAKITLHQC